MHDDPFFQVPRTRRKCSEGQVQLPIFYQDASNVIAFFTAGREAVTELLEGTGLEPALSLNGQVVMGVSMYEYRDTDVGPYNEVGVAVPVFRAGHGRPLTGLLDLFRAQDQRELGFHILDLPVTTAIANAAGRELWGFPKFVTGIDFEWTGRDFRCRVLEPNSRTAILTMEGRVLPLLPLPGLDLVLYSQHKRNMLRTLVTVRNGMQWLLPTGMQLRVGESEHPMAERLRMLGVDGKRPLALFGCDKFQSRLNAGATVPTGAEEEAV